MKASVERLRWVLAGGAVLLLVVLAVFLGFGRYRAIRAWRNIEKRSGIHIARETDGFTYSQSSQGHTIFTLHAAKAIQHGDGKWSMHDVVMTLYGKTSDQVDRIYGSDFEYDENSGVARALGEVHMDLMPPSALAAGKGRVPVPPPPTSGPGGPVDEESDRIIHVRTSGLVYVRKLAVAATDQQVEFRYAGMQCFARGAEFDNGESTLRLLADVVLTGKARGKPITVHAVKADLNRQTELVALVKPVVESQGQIGQAANALLHLRKDGSIERAEASGSIALDAATRHVTAEHLDATFNTASLPQTSRLWGGVTLTDSRPTGRLNARAAEVDSTFNAQGAPTNITSFGSAQLALTEQKPNTPTLARAFRGDRIVATLVPTGVKTMSRLTEVHATGSAFASGESPVLEPGSPTPLLKTTTIAADDLRALFDSDSAQRAVLRHVSGQGHTRLEQDAPHGAQQTSSADTLEMAFASRPLSPAAQPAAQPASQSGGKPAASFEISTATQTGHVFIHSVPATRPAALTTAASPKPVPPTDASADRAVFDGATEKLALTGSVHFTQGETALTTAALTVDQRSGDADAQGEVLATLTKAPAAGPQTASADATHIAAEEAHLAHISQVAEFLGTDARPARLWQGPSQITAARIVLDQKRRSLSARPAAPSGLVHAVFAGASQAKNAPPAPPATAKSDALRKPSRLGEPGAAEVVRVASPVMDYTDIEREATFSGGVHIDGTAGRAQSDRATVFFNPPPPANKSGQPAAASNAASPNPFGGTLQRVVLSGAVHLNQPGRDGTGDQLTYTAADSTYILTGTPAHPPHVLDVKQGSVTGATLVFRQDDSSIVVGGAAPTPAQPKHGRVRTETEVRQ